MIKPMKIWLFFVVFVSSFGSAAWGSEEELRGEIERIKKVLAYQQAAILALQAEGTGNTTKPKPAEPGAIDPQVTVYCSTSGRNLSDCVNCAKTNQFGSQAFKDCVKALPRP